MVPKLTDPENYEQIQDVLKYSDEKEALVNAIKKMKRGKERGGRKAPSVSVIFRNRLQKAGFIFKQIPMIEERAPKGLDCVGAARILTVIEYPKHKIKALKVMAPHIVDPDEYAEIVEEFEFPYDKAEAKEIVLNPADHPPEEEPELTDEEKAQATEDTKAMTSAIFGMGQPPQKSATPAEPSGPAAGAIPGGGGYGGAPGGMGGFGGAAGGTGGAPGGYGAAPGGMGGFGAAPGGFGAAPGGFGGAPGGMGGGFGGMCGGFGGGMGGVPPQNQGGNQSAQQQQDQAANMMGMMGGMMGGMMCGMMGRGGKKK